MSLLALVLWLMFIPLSGLLGYFWLRWLIERPPPPIKVADPDAEFIDSDPEPQSATHVDLSYEYVGPLLEQLQRLLSGGFSDKQLQVLHERLQRLRRGESTYAFYPVVQDGMASDLLITFIRLEEDCLRCEIQGSQPLIFEIEDITASLPQRVVGGSRV